MKPPNGPVYWLDIGEFVPYADRHGRMQERPGYRDSGTKRLYRNLAHARSAQCYQQSHGYPNATIHVGDVTWRAA